jgi:FtsH-binding integral membrane protein
MSNGLWDRYGTAQVQGVPGAGARSIGREAIDEGLRAHMLRVYNYMATGLAISGLVAWILAHTAVGGLFYQYDAAGRFAGYSVLGFIAMFAPLVMLLGASFMMRSMTGAKAQAFYWAFVALQGVSIGVLLQVYTGESVARVFFITGAAFAALSLFGYTTKKNLSGFGNFLFIGLIGIVLLSIVNIFVGSSMLMFIIGIAGILVFAGLIAYDTQRIKEEYTEAMLTGDAGTVHAVWSALGLYINFINLFQFLLMFLGNREE